MKIWNLPAWLIPLMLLVTACESEHEQKNVVLIVVDTLRADRMGLYGYERPTTPELERFAETDEKVEQGYRVCPTGKGHYNTLTQQVRKGVLEMGGK
jgi:hypothetical protein